ncbi:TnpV protein [Extibacter muris]|uniref:TnpV protein n=1 Tax=Extibacter muris TaxID=1796622 RepID=A0A4R4FFI9_9FIRM|nr:TnpV protein [Extibacter muris]MCU0078464.1 TnpV protein [Extibacter muris]TDA21589.1 TnpV protein [Extibacter muris]
MKAVTYSKQGDYLIPKLTVPDEPEGHIGKYGSLRRMYLRENHYGLFISLMTQGKLKQHLTEIQETAQSRMEQITTEMKAAQNVTEELKASDPMMWVGLMNNIRQSAEEIVMKELIYV